MFIGMGWVQAYAQKTQNLTWDIQLQKGRELEVIPKSQIITAESGETVTFFISPASDCFCYVPRAQKPCM